MKARVIVNTVIVTFSVLFACVALSVLAADRLHSMALKALRPENGPSSAMALLEKACRFDPSNAALYYRKYEILQILADDASGDELYAIRKRQLRLLAKCLELRPLWPAYHLSYGLTVYRMAPAPNVITRELILSELKKAASLKSYSSLYCKIYEDFTAALE